MGAEGSRELGGMATPPEQLAARVKALTDSITFQAYNYTRRGTLEADKMIIATMRPPASYCVLLAACSIN